MYKRIVLAYDGSQSGQKALLDCQDLAQWSQAELALVAVLPLGIGLGGHRGRHLRRRADGARKRGLASRAGRWPAAPAKRGHQATGALLTGDTVEEITTYAKKLEADLIVVGHRHLDGWAARWWKSSVSKALIAHAHCSVLVVITS